METFFSYLYPDLYKKPIVTLQGLISQKSTLSIASILGRLSFAFIFLFSIVFQSNSVFAANPFPHYPIIENNVRFWETIYSRYSTSQGVIHDSDNLGIVYEVIPIFDHRLPGASKLNRPIFKGTKRKYSKILNKLAKGIAPGSSEEKRVAALFGKVSRKRLKNAADFVRVQIGQKNRFLEGVIRSGAYMSEIKKILKTEGLPEDLAYLPHVESSFNLRAYSKFGASGIWQFTRPTGKQFLTINYALDERQDPILASHAAASFLKNNYKLLGSWPLALTAYNYGPAGMQRAKKTHLSYEQIFANYKKGYFKFASRNFYSEFLAAKRVAKRLEKDPSIKRDKPQRTLKFTLPGYIATRDLCKHFNISINSLKRLNPALRNSVLQGKKYIPKGYTLHLPSTYRQKELLSKLPGHLYHSKQKPTQFHRVKRGDTAGKVALTYKVSLKSLRRANNLDKNGTIFVGQNLRIPGSANNTGIINSKQSRIKKAKKAAVKMSPSNMKTQGIPTLADSKKNKPEWKNIQIARNVVMGELSVRNISKVKNSRQGTITIQPEESIELIADWLQVQSRYLRRMNNFSPTHKLHPDEKIRIPLRKVSAKSLEEKRFDFHLETEEDFFSAYKIVGVSSYKVKQGDTVWEICKNKFDLPLWLLKKYNAKLNFSSLRSSQRLTIPIVRAI
jgi:membrane-bound lytic murein transglycosylase D